MHGEVPEFKRCLFCFPLRRGLLAWGYAKLALNLLTIAYVVAMILWYFRRDPSFETGTIVMLTVIMTSLLTDLCFDVIFIMASHKKSVKFLNVSYIYNMVWLGLVLLGTCFQLYVNLCHVYSLWNHYPEYRKYMVMDFLINGGLAFSLIFVQVYLILLIRSESAKLRKQSLEMQFSNHLASGQPQCTLHNASLADQCAGKKQVVQNYCTGEKQVMQDCCTGEKQVCCMNEEKTPV